MPDRPAETPRDVTLRPEVLAFAQVMERKLRQHDAERGASWKDCDWQFLRDRLDTEVFELTVAVQKDRGVAEEAADVANFAMMLADNLGHLSLPIPLAAPSPVEVTDEMVEACIQYELSTYSRPTFAPIVLEQAREFYRGLLTDALRAPHGREG